MQTLLGLSEMGELRHAELISLDSPAQMLRLAQTRWSCFEQIEIWEEAVCVLRLPPDRTSSGFPRR